MNRSLPALVALCLLAASAAFAGVSQAKFAPVGSAVTLDGVVTQVDDGECYIQSEDRSAGIWVAGATEGLNIGDVVSAIGTREVVSGEACITGAAITPQGRQSVVNPFSMNNRAIGGSMPVGCIYDYLRLRIPGDGYEWKWVKAAGLCNTGLLVKTWGTVRAVYYPPTEGAPWFYIDDGSNTVSDYGDTGVLVYSDAEVEQGDFVMVTGISSAEPSFDSPARLLRVIRTRDAADVAVIRPYHAPEYPFSDEFDAAKLDQRWAVISRGGAVSVTSNPGWLTLTAPAPVSMSTDKFSPALSQCLYEDWTVELKARVELHEPEPAKHEVRIVTYYTPVYPVAGSYPEYASALATLKLGYGISASYGRKIVLGASNLTVPLTGDTFYFRFTRTAHKTYANLSFDGVTYLPEDVNIGPTVGNFLNICLSSAYWTGGTPFTAHIDYFRYTGPTRGDSQQ